MYVFCTTTPSQSIVKLCNYVFVKYSFRLIFLLSKSVVKLMLCANTFGTLPVEKLMFYGFDMLKGAVVLNKSEQLYLAIVMRMTDNKQVY